MIENYWDYLDQQHREARYHDLIQDHEDTYVAWCDGTDTEWTPNKT